MDFLLDTPLAAAERHLDRTAIVGDAAWTWRQVHIESLLLADRLEAGATVFNLCVSRFGFLVAWLAALRRGCLQMLPPSGGHTDLIALLKSSTSPVILLDDAGAIEPRWAEHARCVVSGARPQADDATLRTHPPLAWAPDWDAPLVCLHTSGSTGQPQPQLKSLRQLARGAQVLAARLDTEVAGGLPAVQRMVCSVPPQHMFGVESSVMLPLVTGIAVLDAKPLLPADVRAAFESASGDAAWVTTPLHLRALAQAKEELPGCAFVLASTMPLAPELAARCEALTHAPVLEIYGSTETGVVAMRRTASQTRWRLVDGVRIVPAQDGSQVWGDHFTSPRTLSDAVEIDAQGDFELLGRQGDLIKIAGRRASLAGLNLLLQEMPGLTDGVFYLPQTGSATERLVLIHAGAALDKAAAQQWLRERMDPVFLPRTLIHVDRLPRSEVGKLPRAALDEIYAARGASASRERAGANAANDLQFDFSVAADHPSLAGHFPGHPVVPGVLLVDHVFEALHRLTGRRVSRLQRVKFTSALLPDEQAHAHCVVDGTRVSFRVTTLRGGAAVSLADGVAIVSPEARA